MAGDFVLLNILLQIFVHWHWRVGQWPERSAEIFILVNNITLMISMLRFSTIIHLRLVGAGDIIQRLVGLTFLQAVLAYLLLKVVDYDQPIGWLQWELGTGLMVCLLVKRYMERWMVKLYREAGRNTRTVTLVGSDPELVDVYRKLKDDLTLVYIILGYYGEDALKEVADASDEAIGNKNARLSAVAGNDGGLLKWAE